MRIEEAIKLQNARQRIKNEFKGRAKNHNIVNKAIIGRKIWTEQAGKKPLSSMSALVKGKTKTIKILWIDIICIMCGVDANFLLGQPSKHDADYLHEVIKKENN